MTVESCMTMSTYDRRVGPQYAADSGLCATVSDQILSCVPQYPTRYCLVCHSIRPDVVLCATVSDQILSRPDSELCATVSDQMLSRPDSELCATVSDQILSRPDSEQCATVCGRTLSVLSSVL